MTNKPTVRDKKATLKAVFTGAALGAVLMPIFFTIVSLGTEFTGEKVMWLCINSLCTGILVGGGLGYLMTSKDVFF